MRLKKDYLSGLLEGYKKANELIASERRRRLAQMTAKNSVREYDYLCRLYAVLEKKGLERLESRKISSLIKRRQTLNNERGVRN
ncbi:MAG: hypothetical protein HY753_04065 [Nitrospirae bacterium]|nr:hypothetical protein [Nitrospirota bacterium]